MNSEQVIDPEKRHQMLYRILLFLTVPACGFVSAGFAYILYFAVDTIWPYIMIPASLLVMLLLFVEANLESGRLTFLAGISRSVLNLVSIGVLVIFTSAFLWWIFYLVFFVELQK